jgi:outer membrane protein
MKKLIIFLIAVVIGSSTINAQKIAYVDMDYILKAIPAYQRAQKQLDDISATWQKDIEVKMAEVSKMYNSFQSEQVLLTEQLKEQRMTAIESKEKEIKQLQKDKFGPNGELFKKRQELIKPIQDQVYNEIQKMATEKKFDFIFDKANGPYMLYTNPIFDKSDEILQGLGIK